MLRPTKPGLEVLNAAGEWIDAPPLEGAYVVNIGDMLEIWSNGYFTSTSHRVRQVAEERYAFPLFFNVDYDVLVEPLPRFMREDGTNKIALKAGEHLYAQTIQVFGYLQRRLDAKEIAMPEVWVTPEWRCSRTPGGGAAERRRMIPNEFTGGWVRRRHQPGRTVLRLEDATRSCGGCRSQARHARTCGSPRYREAPCRGTPTSVRGERDRPGTDPR